MDRSLPGTELQDTGLELASWESSAVCRFVALQMFAAHSQDKPLRETHNAVRTTARPVDVDSVAAERAGEVEQVPYSQVAADTL